MSRYQRKNSCNKLIRVIHLSFPQLSVLASQPLLCLPQSLTLIIWHQFHDLWSHNRIPTQLVPSALRCHPRSAELVGPNLSLVLNELRRMDGRLARGHGVSPGGEDRGPLRGVRVARSPRGTTLRGVLCFSGDVPCRSGVRACGDGQAVQGPQARSQPHQSLPRAREHGARSGKARHPRHQ
jgi:hypothetical protein